MRLAERFDSILGALPPNWAEARLALAVPDEAQADRAAVMLAPLTPGRSGSSFRLTVSATGSGGPSPEAVRRVLERLEAQGVDARLALPGTASFQTAPPTPHEPRAGLAGRWDELVARLPVDWSDVYVELELASSDDLDRAALLLGPVNPLLYEGPRPVFRFRAARSVGYGAATAMARRVLARLDEEEIAGSLRLLREHADVDRAHTQGIVWREGGRAV